LGFAQILFIMGLGAAIVAFVSWIDCELFEFRGIFFVASIRLHGTHVHLMVLALATLFSNHRFSPCRTEIRFHHCMDLDQAATSIVSQLPPDPADNSMCFITR